MNELTAILTAHAAKYPNMQPQDAVKLLYQNEFGPGHLVSDHAAALDYLRRECSTVTPDPTAPLIEDIGNGLVRVMLAALNDEEYSPEMLNDHFVRSAGLHMGTLAGFLQKLDVLRALTVQGLFSFRAEELDAYLTDYMAMGCPAVSHSPVYRDAYHPAYRVVRRACLPPLPVILHAITQLPVPTGRPLLVAIDGRCASGKSTLAARLQKACGCAVVHMDDFFLRPEQRTRERYETPGGNVDHERFLSEVLQPLQQGKAARYRPFDCWAQRLTAPVCIEPAPVLVVEGSYSCHPELWSYYDLRIFLTVSPETQMQRIENRDGSEYAGVFRTKWIPLEEAYFSACNLANKCDFCFET